MIAREVMSSPVWTVPSGGTIAHARKLMVKHRISRLLVMDGEELAGILTKKDIAFRLREQEPAWRCLAAECSPIPIAIVISIFGELRSMVSTRRRNRRR